MDLDPKKLVDDILFDVHGPAWTPKVGDFFVLKSYAASAGTRGTPPLLYKVVDLNPSRKKLVGELCGEDVDSIQAYWWEARPARPEQIAAWVAGRLQGKKAELPDWWIEKTR